MKYSHSSMYGKWAVMLIAISILLTGCGLSSEEKNAMNLDAGVVKIEIEVHRFDIPLRYMYQQTIETYGRWPTPKLERESVGGLSLSVLLPAMRPYYKEDDAKWKVQGHGDRVEVALAKGVPRGVLSRKAIFDFAEQGSFYRSEPDIYGLIHFSEKTGNLYFTKNEDGPDVWIRCGTPELPPKWNGFYSPSCMVDSSYRSGLVLRYVYALSYLAQWKKIDDNLKAMFDQFALAAQTQTK